MVGATIAMPSTTNPKVSSSNFVAIATIIIIILASTINPVNPAPSPLSSSLRSPPPLPVLPIPSTRQIAWQLSDMALLFHIGTNTYTDREWGTGHADPSLFNPKALNASQWISIAKDSGFSRVILTAKHHDGFCLWPSDYTEYSVKSSPWRNGTGDVVGELAEAARVSGVKLGIYLSPWDRHEPRYGRNIEYNEYYLGQMSELLTRYGEITEVWLDNAKGDGEKSMEYFFEVWNNVVHQLQPGAVIFSDGGPDTRWVGNEAGVSENTCWSLFNLTAYHVGDFEPKYAGPGYAFGPDWVPPDCDVSIRPGWFWHASEVPKSALTLLDLYYKSAGRNCRFSLNVPPNSSGLISPEDIKVLHEFSHMRSSIFSSNLAKGAKVSASSTWRNDSRFEVHNVLEEGIYSYWAPDAAHSNWTLYFDFVEAITFNVLLVQEPIQMGQRIIAFHLGFLDEEGEWKTVTSGTTVGYRRLLLFRPVKTSHLRFVVDSSRAMPLISHFGLYMDMFSISGHASKMINRGNSNISDF